MARDMRFGIRHSIWKFRDSALLLRGSGFGARNRERRFTVSRSGIRSLWYGFGIKRSGIAWLEHRLGAASSGIRNPEFETRAITFPSSPLVTAPSVCSLPAPFCPLRSASCLLLPAYCLPPSAYSPLPASSIMAVATAMEVELTRGAAAGVIVGVAEDAVITSELPKMAATCSSRSP